MADEDTQAPKIEFPREADALQPCDAYSRRERACIDLKVPDSGCDWLNTLIMASRELDIDQSIEQFKRMVPVQLEMGANMQRQAKAAQGKIAVPIRLGPGGRPLASS